MAKAGRWEPKGGRTPSKDIVVDQVRDLVDHRLAMKRFEGRRRFVIVDPADAMNPQAQNALLKTLEEPPGETTLVLVASSPDALLPTIRSRCLRVPFAPIPAAALAARLELEGHAARQGAPRGGALGRLPRARPGRGRRGPRRRGGRRSVAPRPSIRATPAPGSPSPGTTAGIARRRGRSATCSSSGSATSLAAQAGASGLALADLGEATRAARGDARSRRGAPAPPRGPAGRRGALRHNGAPVLALESMLIGWFHGRA